MQCRSGLEQFQALELADLALRPVVLPHTTLEHLPAPGIGSVPITRPDELEPGPGKELGHLLAGTVAASPKEKVVKIARRQGPAPRVSRR